VKLREPVVVIAVADLTAGRPVRHENSIRDDSRVTHDGCDPGRRAGLNFASVRAIHLPRGVRSRPH